MFHPHLKHPVVTLFISEGDDCITGTIQYSYWILDIIEIPVQKWGMIGRTAVEVQLIRIQCLPVIFFCNLLKESYSIYDILLFQKIYVRNPLKIMNNYPCKERKVSCPISPCSPVLSAIETSWFATYIYLWVLLSLYIVLYPSPLSRKSTPALSQVFAWRITPLTTF